MSTLNELDNLITKSPPKKRKEECPKLQCHLCPFTTTYKVQFDKHIESHSYEKAYICEICFYRAKESDYYSKHMKTHSNEKSFRCDACPYQGKRKDYLSRHVRNRHPEKPILSCDYCSFNTFWSDELLTHQLTTHFDVVVGVLTTTDLGSTTASVGYQQYGVVFKPQLDSCSI